jgi:hypothetical protein
MKTQTNQTGINNYHVTKMQIKPVKRKHPKNQSGSKYPAVFVPSGKVEPEDIAEQVSGRSTVIHEHIPGVFKRKI